MACANLLTVSTVMSSSWLNSLVAFGLATGPHAQQRSRAVCRRIPTGFLQTEQTWETNPFSTPYACFLFLLNGYRGNTGKFSTTLYSNSQPFSQPIRKFQSPKRLTPPISATLRTNICPNSQPLRRTFAGFPEPPGPSFQAAAATASAFVTPPWPAPAFSPSAR